MTALPPTINDATVTLTFGAAGVYYGYCTQADVKFEFTNLQGYTTLSASAIGQEITYAGIELQEALDHIYQMPYAGTDMGILTRLRDLNAKLASAKLIDRYFSGSSPNHAQAADDMKRFVHEMVVAIEEGLVRWDFPFGDAVTRTDLPVYNRASLATIVPNPSLNSTENAPIFSITRDRFRREDQM